MIDYPVDASNEPIECKLIAACSDGTVNIYPEKFDRVRAILDEVRKQAVSDLAEPTVEQEWKCLEPTCDMKRIPSLLYCSKHSAFSAENRALEQDDEQEVRVCGKHRIYFHKQDCDICHWLTLAKAEEKVCPGCGLPMSDGNGCHMSEQQKKLPELLADLKRHTDAVILLAQVINREFQMDGAAEEKK